MGKIRPEWGLVGLTVLWGLSFPLTKMVLQQMPPFSFLTIRFGIALVCVGLFWLLHRPRAKPTPQFWIHSLLLGLVLFVGFVFQTLGQQFISSGRAALITGLSTLFVFLFEWILLKKIPPRLVFIGLFLNLVGLFCLHAQNLFSVDDLKTDSVVTLKGDLLVLGCAIFFGLHIVLITKIAHKYSTPLVSASQLLVVFLCAGLMNLGTASISLPHLSQQTIGAILFLGIFVTALTLLVHTRLQKMTTPTRTALILALEPLLAAFFAWLISDEKQSSLFLIGGTLMICGATIAAGSAKTFPLRRFLRRRRR